MITPKFEKPNPEVRNLKSAIKNMEGALIRHVNSYSKGRLSAAQLKSLVGSLIDDGSRRIKESLKKIK